MTTDEDCRPLHTSTPLLGVDDAQRIVCVNEAGEDLLGVRADLVIGRPCYEILDGLDVYGNRYCIRDCPAHCARRQGEHPNPFELRVRGRRGRVRVQVHTLHVNDRAAHYLMLAPVEMQQTVSSRPPPPPPTSPDVRIRRPADAEDALTEPLTPRETEVLQHVARGATTAQIAKALFIAEATVRNHVQRILQKLDAHSRIEAVARARDLGLL